MKKPDTYAISDFHFGDYGIINWERTQFKDSAAHDAFILEKMNDWYNSAASGSKLWVLGDFGNLDTLPEFFKAVSGNGKWIELNFLKGNHDKAADMFTFSNYFDNVYDYPVYLSNRLILSHEPQWPLPKSCANIHGHLHKALLDSDCHVSVSCNDIGYKPYKFSNLNGVFSKVDPYNMKFLWEPYAEHYIFKDKERRDIVMDPISGKVDLSASRALQKAMRDSNWNLQKDITV